MKTENLKIKLKKQMIEAIRDDDKLNYFILNTGREHIKSYFWGFVSGVFVSGLFFWVSYLVIKYNLGY